MVNSTYEGTVSTLALNQTFKSRTGQALNSKKSDINPKPITSLLEFHKQKTQHDKDVKMLEDDLKLLSALLGRPINQVDIPMLANQVTKTTSPSKHKRVIFPNVETTTLKKSSTNNFVDSNELHYYGKSNEAILASIFRQQGIGPENNNLPVSVSMF